MYVCILRVDLNKFDISKTQVKFCLLEKLQALQKKNIIKNARKSTQRCTSQTCKTCKTCKTHSARTARTALSARIAHSARTAHFARTAHTAHTAHTAPTAHTALTVRPEISHTLNP